MSTNNECALVESRPGEWFYILEDRSAPKNARDWREYAQAYGPFPSYDAATQDLADSHANPGGHSIRRYQPDYTPDEVENRLFDAARVDPV